MFPETLFIVAPDWEELECPSVEEWINRSSYFNQE